MRIHPIMSLVEEIYIINLAARTDRRHEMAEQLARVGLSLDQPGITLFPAVRPEGPGDFPSTGARGCFLSHLGVLQDAQRRGLERIFILEDDADFSISFVDVSEGVFETLKGLKWDFFYFGYVAKGPINAGGMPSNLFALCPSTTHLGTTHAMVLTKRAIDGLVPYLEKMLMRRPGDPSGGPMHVDGAYSWFRQENPQFKTVITKKQLVAQRASRTDIDSLTWKECVPFVSTLRRLCNKLRQHKADW